MFNSRKFKSFIIISRPFMSFICGLVSSSVYICSAQHFDRSICFFILFISFLTTSWAFIINDIYDIEKDKINNRSRILAAKELSPKEAYILAFIYVSLSLSISSLISLTVFITNLFMILCAVLYSIINNKNGIIANIVAALLSFCLFIIGMLPAKISAIPTLIGIASFFFIFGREIILDIRDIQGDLIIGKISLPISYGNKFSILFSGVLFIICSLILISINIIIISINYMLFISILFNIFLWFSFIYYVINRDLKSMNLFIISTRIAILLLCPGIVFA